MSFSSQRHKTAWLDTNHSNSVRRKPLRKDKTINRDSDAGIDLAEKIFQRRRQILDTDDILTVETQTPEPVESDDIFCIRGNKKRLNTEIQSDKTSPSIGKKSHLLSVIKKVSVSDEPRSAEASDEEYYDTGLRRSPSLVNMQAFSVEQNEEENKDVAESSDDQYQNTPHLIVMDADEIEQKSKTKSKKTVHKQSSEMHLDSDDDLLFNNYTTFEVDPALEEKAKEVGPDGTEGDQKECRGTGKERRGI